MAPADSAPERFLRLPDARNSCGRGTPKGNRTASLRLGLVAAALVGCLFPAVVAAQIQHDTAGFTITQWTTDEGLPTNVLHDLAISPDGYLWVATYSGLTRFDGVRFWTFDLSNAPQLGGLRLRSLVADETGNLWVSARDGNAVTYRDGAFRVMLRGSDHGSIQTLVGGPARGVWAVTDTGLVLFRNGRRSFIRLGDIRSAYAGRGGALWVARGTDLECYRDSVLVRSIPNPVPSDDYGMFTPSTDGGVVYHSRRFITFVDAVGQTRLPARDAVAPDLWDLARSADGSWAPSCFLVDEGGVSWIGTEAGLFRVRGVPFSPARPDSSGAECVLGYSMAGRPNGIFEDPGRAVWVATEAGGLFRIAPSVTAPMPDLPGWNVPMSLVTTTPHSRWLIGTERAGPGAVHLLRNLCGTVLARVPVPRRMSTATEAADGGAWIAGTDTVRHYALGVVDSVLVPPPAWRPLAKVLETSDGALVWRARDGLCRFHDGSYSVIAPADAVPFRATRDGSLWYRRQDELDRYRDGRTTRFDRAGGLPAGGIRDVWVDPQGTAWLSTYGSGLVCLAGDRVLVADRSSGLPDNRLGGILDDDMGRLWINSNRGIFVVHQGALARFAAGQAGYLPCRLVTHVESGNAWAARGGDGRLYFKALDRVLSADPARLPPPSAPPAARIQTLRYRGADHAADGRMTLPRGVRDFSVEYTAPALYDGDEVRFRYRWDGGDWIDVGERRDVALAQARSGSHAFEVVAANAAGVWADAGDALSLTLPRYLFETGWFRVLVALAVAGTVLGAYRWRTQIQRRHLIAVRAEVEQRRRAEASLRDMGRRLLDAQEVERRRIAGELHDDIHQRVALLAVKLDMSGTFPDLADEAQRLSGDVRRLSHSLHSGRLEQLGLRAAMEALCEDVSASSGVEIPLVIGGLPEDPSPVASLCIYRICQEAARNAVKHSGSARVAVTLRTEGPDLVLEVRDDGDGFDPEAPPSRGLGLASMAERAGAAGGALEIESTPGAGTTVRGRVPWKGR